MKGLNLMARQMRAAKVEQKRIEGRIRRIRQSRRRVQDIVLYTQRIED